MDLAPALKGFEDESGFAGGPGAAFTRAGLEPAGLFLGPHQNRRAHAAWMQTQQQRSLTRGFVSLEQLRNST